MDDLLADRHVLVVEDEMLLLILIEGMLGDLGCTSIMAAATVDQALGLIRSQSFDVAMLDVNLAGIRSDAVADALARQGIPFLLSTGCSDLDETRGYSDRPVLRKPYRPETLEAALTTLLMPKAQPA